MSQKVDYVIQHMAAERGISEEKLRDLIHSAIQARPSIREAFGDKEPTVDELISNIGEMIERLLAP